MARPQRAMGFADVSGGRVPVWVIGRGRSALVLHGGPDTGSTYLHRPMARAIGDAVRLHFFDLSGTGRAGSAAVASGSPDSLLDGMLSDAEHVRQHFRLSSCHLIGHSFGALLALMYAERFPDRVSSLLLIDPDPPVRAEWEAGRQAIAERRSREDSEWLRVEGPRVRDADPDAWYRVALRPCFADPRSAEALRVGLSGAPRLPGGSVGPLVRAELGQWDLTPMVGDIGVPVLVVTGSASPFPPRSLEAYRDRMPRCRLAVVEDAGHFPHMENPAGFRHAVMGFLTR